MQEQENNNNGQELYDLDQIDIMMMKPMVIALCLVSASICDRVAMLIYRMRDLNI